MGERVRLRLEGEETSVRADDDRQRADEERRRLEEQRRQAELRRQEEARRHEEQCLSVHSSRPWSGRAPSAAWCTTSATTCSPSSTASAMWWTWPSPSSTPTGWSAEGLATSRQRRLRTRAAYVIASSCWRPWGR